MLSDLLRNLTFKRNAHCTQVSDQCPLGLLLIKGVQRLDGDSSGNCCNWLEIGLGTVTDRSPTNSESNFNWSVASLKLVDDLSDGTILWRDQCAIKYVT